MLSKYRCWLLLVSELTILCFADADYEGENEARTGYIQLLSSANKFLIALLILMV
jgi:hypothetical protein